MKFNKYRNINEICDIDTLLARGVDSVSCGVLIFDIEQADQPVVYVNDAFCHMTGYSAEEIIGKNCRFLQGAETDTATVQKIRNDISAGRNCTVDIYNYRKDGSGFYNRLHLSPILGTADHGKYYCSIQYDVTDERKINDLLHQQNAAFSNVLAASPSGVIIIDSNDMVLYANRSAEYLLSDNGLSLVGRYIPLEVSSEGKQEFEFQSSNGQTIIAEVVIVQTRWAEMPARVVMIRDVTAVHTAEKRAMYAESYDTLTGLANRYEFRRHIDQICYKYSINDIKPALILLDIKNFHIINDKLGSSKGDQLLVDITERLKAFVSEKTLVARIGGDRFALLFECIDNYDELYNKTLDIITCLKKSYGYGILTDSGNIKFNCGVAIAEHENRDILNLVNNAEAAVKTAKNQESQEPPFQIFTSELAEEERKIQDLDVELRQAMLKDQFCVYYQPQVCLKERSLVGFEALVRWEHPSEGILSPAAFIHRLEKLKLISTLGHDVLRKVSKQLVEWEECFNAPSRIAVNLSAVQLSDMQTADSLQYAILDGGVSPERITLELTESAALSDMNTTIEILHKLRQCGIAFALDDFGTGYSALSHLRVLPVDTVKLDRSFVNDLPNNNIDSGLVRAMVEMSHALGKKVIAEGVETSEQEEYLYSIGCDWAQGFLYGRPESADIIHGKWFD